MRESFTEICQDMMNPNIGVFIFPPDRTNELPEYVNVLIPNPSAPQIYLKCAGALIGAACASNISQRLRLPEFLWRYLCGIDITLDDIFNHDKSFMELVDSVRNASDKDINDYLNVNWSVTLASGKEMVIKEGKVSFAERDEYLDTIEKIKLNEMREALGHILQGFNLIVPPNVVQTLSPQYLEYLVCGKKNLTADEVIDVIQGDNTTPELLFDVLREFDEENLKLFLKFVTGLDTIPVGSKEKLITVIKIDSSSKEKPLPKSSTCFNKLYLADFKDKEELKKKLELSIHQKEINDQ
jgi:hypothetical protein